MTTPSPSDLTVPTDVLPRLQAALTDGYVLDREIGRGGMATVYLAHDRRHDRRVAIKVLRSELAGLSDLPRRFHREIRFAARLTHPHILAVHDSGERDGFLYYVMPFLGCESLRDRIDREGQLPIEEALRITRAVASGLDYAHRQEVVHRDIKPENIMLVDGHPVITDFGIARALSEAAPDRITGVSIAVGTPAYMSPEQAAGEMVDGRSDQYSLACVAYEMLVGHPPFPGGSDRATIARHIIEAPAPIVPNRATVPPAVEWAIMKALAKEPAGRFATATEFAEALTRAAPEIGVVAAGGMTRDARAIAVLPFVNASPDPGDEYLSDGLTDELINALAHVDGLHVTSPTSAFALKGRVMDVREAGTLLGVTFVLEGSVRRSGARVRITVQLTNALDGRLVWSSRYDRDAQEMFAVEEEIARTIVSTLRGTLLGDLIEPATRRYTDNARAYHLYLRGRHAWARRSPEAVSEGIGYFEQAIAEDPGFALAYTGLSDCYALQIDYRGAPVAEGMERARAEAQRALALDDSLAEAHTSLAWVLFIYDWDWLAAEREFRRAIELDPRYGTARQWYAWLLMALGRQDESLMHARMAVELDPSSISIRRSLGWLYSMARQCEAAIAYLRRTLALDPSSEESHRVLGLAYLQKGMYREAAAAFEEALTLEPETAYALAGLAATHARAGHDDEAARLLGRLDEMAARRYVSPVAYAVVHAARADADATFAALERSYAERRGWMTYLRVEPLLDPIRTDRRFTGWLRKMNLD